MVFDILAVVAFILSSVCTLFLGALVYFSNRKFKQERDRFNSIKNSFFGDFNIDENS